VSANQDNETQVRGPESFGIALREYRHRAGLTQADVAERANVHRTYLAGLENGSTTEAVRNLVRALHALDLEIVIRPRRREP
jgi:transcriptional regulator with XRE-family HTH domain